MGQTVGPLGGGVGVAPGTSGNVLTSNGTAWTSAAPAGGIAYTAQTVLGSGTDYTLTTTPAVITFGTSGALELTVTTTGTYNVEVGWCENLASITASATANGSFVQLYLDSGGGFSAVANSLRVGASIPILASAIAGITGMPHHVFGNAYDGISLTSGNKLRLYAAKAAATTGAWTVQSDVSSGTATFIRITRTA